jgi:hypothetical protein
MKILSLYIYIPICFLPSFQKLYLLSITMPCTIFSMFKSISQKFSLYLTNKWLLTKKSKFCETITDVSTSFQVLV